MKHKDRRSQLQLPISLGETPIAMPAGTKEASHLLLAQLLVEALDAERRSVAEGGGDE
jgi:hypothetical protein